MNWSLATDQQLAIIIACDQMARLSDVAEAKAELERRRNGTNAIIGGGRDHACN